MKWLMRYFDTLSIDYVTRPTLAHPSPRIRTELMARRGDGLKLLWMLVKNQGYIKLYWVLQAFRPNWLERCKTEHQTTVESGRRTPHSLT